MAGRSHCKTCERNLWALELVPIFSWLFQWGKCAWCKNKISGIYPILEVSTGILFAAVWVFLIDPNLIFAGNILEWVRMLFFVSIMFLTIIYVFYDILYLEIPESILVIANIWVLGALIAQWLWYSIIPYLTNWGLNITTLIICISVIAALYYVMLAELKEIYDCLIVLACMWAIWGYMYFWNIVFHDSALLSGTIAALWVFISFFLQIILSGGRAMWGGDLRIAILMGLLVWVSLAFPAWMICYLIGSIVWIFLIIKFKIKSGLKSSFNHQIPFGPFIASWYLVVLFFAPQIQSVLQQYF
jgi:prepilin signal peptidase PulO-like enzyme (type II secretory pathway)